MRLELLDVPADLTSVRQLIPFRAAIATRRGEGALVDAFIQQALHAVDAIEFYSTRVADIERTIRHLVKPFKELLGLYGVSYIVAAGLVGYAGDLRNCRSADSFAMRSAVAPVPCSSGRNEQVRLNLGGNRQLNRLLHVIAVTQVSHRGTTGRSYYERKVSEGKTPRAALRSLKRRLATVVYYRLRADLHTVDLCDLVLHHELADLGLQTPHLSAMLRVEVLSVDLERFDPAAHELVGPLAVVALRNAVLARRLGHRDLAFEDLQDDGGLALCRPSFDRFGLSQRRALRFVHGSPS
jgi:hypothetical protein